MWFRVFSTDFLNFQQFFFFMANLVIAPKYEGTGASCLGLRSISAYTEEPHLLSIILSLEFSQTTKVEASGRVHRQSHL